MPSRASWSMIVFAYGSFMFADSLPFAFIAAGVGFRGGAEALNCFLGRDVPFGGCPNWSLPPDAAPKPLATDIFGPLGATFPKVG